MNNLEIYEERSPKGSTYKVFKIDTEKGETVETMGSFNRKENAVIFAQAVLELGFIGEIVHTF